MAGYWIRHRFLFSSFFIIFLMLITVNFFVYPYIVQNANNYNLQSVYKNTEIDFIAPEPSLEQVDNLSGEYGIGRVFPFFLTETNVSANGKNRLSTILLSDQLQNVDMTMYSPERLIKKSDKEFENPILVDWQFCHDISANIGDIISITLNGETVEYRIYAIYETNSVYDGGAILVPISNNQKNTILQQSNNNGYSGMYISANDYDLCRSYLTMDYRPLGRLKSRDDFLNDEQYRVHYDAIMSSGFSNEITDFRIKEDSLNRNSSPLMAWLGCVFSAIAIVLFNFIMAGRGCEKVYFTKHCIPKGQNVKPYYSISFCFETILGIIFYVLIMVIRVKTSNDYIPSSALNILIVIVPFVVIIAELFSLFMNYSMVSELIKQEENLHKETK